MLPDGGSLRLTARLSAGGGGDARVLSGELRGAAAAPGRDGDGAAHAVALPSAARRGRNAALPDPAATGEERCARRV